MSARDGRSGRAARRGPAPSRRAGGGDPGADARRAAGQRGRMRISAKGEYAIRAVLDLAMHEKAGLVSIQEIASRQGIPPRYLEQVLLQLKRSGLLGSRRGAAGGYHLTRPRDEITVGQVLRAVEGATAPFEPSGVARRGGAAAADLAELWEELSAAVSQVIDRLTFGELAERVAQRLSAARPMYHI